MTDDMVEKDGGFTKKVHKVPPSRLAGKRHEFIMAHVTADIMKGFSYGWPASYQALRSLRLWTFFSKSAVSFFQDIMKYEGKGT